MSASPKPGPSARLAALVVATTAAIILLALAAVVLGEQWLALVSLLPIPGVLLWDGVRASRSRRPH